MKRREPSGYAYMNTSNYHVPQREMRSVSTVREKPFRKPYTPSMPDGKRNAETMP